MNEKEFRAYFQDVVDYIRGTEGYSTYFEICESPNVSIDIDYEREYNFVIEYAPCADDIHNTEGEDSYEMCTCSDYMLILFVVGQLNPEKYDDAAKILHHEKIEAQQFRECDEHESDDELGLRGRCNEDEYHEQCEVNEEDRRLCQSDREKMDALWEECLAEIED